MGHRHNRKRTRSRRRRAYSENISQASTTPGTSNTSPRLSPYPYSSTHPPPILHRDSRQLSQQPDAHLTMGAPHTQAHAYTNAIFAGFAYTYPSAYGQQLLQHQHRPALPASSYPLQARRPSSAPTIDAVAAAAAERRRRDRGGYFHSRVDGGVNNRRDNRNTRRTRTSDDELGDELSSCPGAETVVRFLFDGKMDFVDAPSRA